jgi:hypothetical protein
MTIRLARHQRAARTTKISNRGNASDQERSMQQMESHRRTHFARRRCKVRQPCGVRLRDTLQTMGRHDQRQGSHRPNDMLRAADISAKAQAFVALAMTRNLQIRFVVVALAALVGRYFCLAVQAMARPMTAPAREGLRQHESHHQFGNQCLHKARIFLPIITVIGSWVNAACDKLGPPAVLNAFPGPIFP